MTNRGKRNLRADAALALFDILEQGKSAREVLPKYQQAYQDKDKAWLQEMVMGVLRQLPILQYWLRDLLDKPLKHKFKVIEHLIMLGIYQLVFTRISTHAAVSETVTAATDMKLPVMKGLVNGVLRTFIRQEMEKQMPDNPQILSGLPKWLYRELDTAYPDDLDSMIQAMQSKAPLWLRINRLQSSREEYARLLDSKGIVYTLPARQPDAIVLDKGLDITRLPGFADGLFAVQDGAAQLAAGYLAPQANERILDCCAAPGGKTCHILEQQPELKECVALDFDAGRLTRVNENLARLKHNATVVCGDASQPEQWWDGQLFDRILLDAPCSATGIIRRYPDIKWLRKRADIDQLVTLQQRILRTMWSLLKPGGQLLYATCSILPQENQQQIANFLADTANARLLPINDSETAMSPGWQILPGQEQMDGFYYARLLKSQ